MKNNPRPTLRGTSTCFRGSPGVERVREEAPLPPLIILHRHLFALAWSERQNYKQGKGIGNLSQSESLDCVHPPYPLKGERKAEGICIHPIKVWLGALAYKPPQGAQGDWGQGFVKQFGAVVGEGVASGLLKGVWKV